MINQLKVSFAGVLREPKNLYVASTLDRLELLCHHFLRHLKTSLRDLLKEFLQMSGVAREKNELCAHSITCSTELKQQRISANIGVTLLATHGA